MDGVPLPGALMQAQGKRLTLALALAACKRIGNYWHLSDGDFAANRESFRSHVLERDRFA
jgi:hypothetical protein